jgi:hypothetical protein
MWKTRNIRRRNRGRKTKRQDGGLLPFMGPDMAKMIDYAIKNEMEITAQIEKKNGMFSKTTMSDPFKVKFIKGRQIKFIQDEESNLEEVDTTIKPDTPYRYDIKSSNVEVILNLKTRITLIIDKTSLADIKDKMKIEEENKLQKIKEMTVKTKDAQVQKKEDDKKKKEEDAQKKKEEDEQKRKEELKKKEISKYNSNYISIAKSFTRNPTGSLPYSTHELNYLYYCIETYFPEDSLTKDTVHTFVKEFEKYDSNSPEKEVKEMNKEDAILRLESGIKLFMMNESKTKLQEMVKRLNADPDQLDDYLPPIQSLNKKCSSSIMDDSRPCFVFESLKPYAENELVLLDEDNPDEKLKMSIFDFVENGATPKEMWKNTFEPTIKSKIYYNYFEYVSKGTDADSLAGFACYSGSNHIYKVSNIIWAENEMGEDPNLRDILYSSLINNSLTESIPPSYRNSIRISDGGISNKYSKLFIPEELNEKVNKLNEKVNEMNKARTKTPNAQVYKKGETKDGFTMWDGVALLKPTELEIKLKIEKEPKAQQFLEYLQKLQILFDSIKEKPVPEPNIVESTTESPIVESNEEDEDKGVLPDQVKPDEIQMGGADNPLLNEIISKYPSLKGLKSMIDDLPEDIRQKYESEIKTTLEKVKESNVPETELMNEPEFQDIQTNLNTQFPDKVNDEEAKTDSGEPSTSGEEATPASNEEAPPASGEEVKTDNEEPPTTETEDATLASNEEPPTSEEVKTDSETLSTAPATTPTSIPITASTTPPTTTTSITTTNASIPITATTTPPTTTNTSIPITSTTTTDTSIPTTTTTAIPDASVTTTDANVTVAPSGENALKREDLKESPLLVQPTTGESGKYIFVPKDLVEKTIDFLLNNGCEVTTVNLK